MKRGYKNQDLGFNQNDDNLNVQNSATLKQKIEQSLENQ